MHIVERYHSAAMGRMAQPLVALLGATIGETSKPDDLNLHMPWHFVLDETEGRHAILYTHCNPGDEKKLEEACARSEVVLCMSFKGRQELLDLGVPIEKTWVAYPGSGAFKTRRLNVGLVGYKQPNGRKREHILIDLAYLLPEQTRNMLHFVVAGLGWTQIVEEAKNAGLAVTYITKDGDNVIDQQHLADNELQLLYEALDGFVVSGFAEGGPLPMIEAMSCGAVVFAPEIGFAADLLEEPYRSAEHLAEQLTEWVRPRMERVLLGQSFNWDDYAEEVALACGVEAGHEVGWPRYAQLVKIADECKPEFICEIGTWNGKRALQMIQTAQRHHDKVYYIGFDVFEETTPGLVRKEYSKIGYPSRTVAQRIRASGAGFNLRKGETKVTMKDYRPLKSDLYFIDGGHHIDTIRNDWSWAASNMKPESVVVFDDYCADGPADYGCKAIIDGLGDEFRAEILPVVTKADAGSVQMVKVTRA